MIARVEIWRGEDLMNYRRGDPIPEPVFEVFPDTPLKPLPPARADIVRIARRVWKTPEGLTINLLGRTPVVRGADGATINPPSMTTTRAQWRQLLDDITEAEWREQAWHDNPPTPEFAILRQEVFGGAA